MITLIKKIIGHITTKKLALKKWLSAFINVCAAISLTTILISCDSGTDVDNSNQARKEGDNSSQAREPVNQSSNLTEQILPCSQTDNTCLTIPDFYEKNSKFKLEFQRVLKEANIAEPSWVPDGVSSPFKRMSLYGEAYVMGFICEPHNCGEQSIYAAYNEGSKKIFGVYNSGAGLKWFGSPNDSETNLICEYSDFCVAVTELAATLSEHGFPIMLESSDFNDCFEFEDPKRLVCNEKFVANCPYSTNGCMAGADLTGNQHGSQSFSYKYEEIDHNKLKRDLDTAYGESPVEERQDLLTTWSSNWKHGNVEIGLMRLKGVNISGIPYDNVTVHFQDIQYPDPRGVVKNEVQQEKPLVAETISKITPSPELIEVPSQWYNIKPLYMFGEGEESCYKSEWGIPSSLWGNSENVKEKEFVSADGNSMILVGIYEDGTESKFFFFKSLDKCNVAFKKSH